MKIRGNEGKWAVKQVARRYLPEHLVSRRKVGFHVPLDEWFRGDLEGTARELLLSPSSFVGSTLDRTAVHLDAGSGAIGVPVRCRRDPAACAPER